MANPRAIYQYNRIHAADTGFPVDGTITVPVPGPQGVYTNNGISPQVGYALGLANTGNTLPGAAPLVGLGTTGGMLIGKLNGTDPDGGASVQDEGYMYLPYNTGANIPVIGQPVGVDGTGKVRVLTAALGTAVCVGFGIDPAPLGYLETPALKCIVKM